MRTHQFQFSRRERLIAQRPAAHRDESRLLVLDRTTKLVTHEPRFPELLKYLSRPVAVEIPYVTLHVGLGTFVPVKAAALETIGRTRSHSFVLLIRQL